MRFQIQGLICVGLRACVVATGLVKTCLSEVYLLFAGVRVHRWVGYQGSCTAPGYGKGPDELTLTFETECQLAYIQGTGVLFW